jgi:hypothetical protein
VWAIPDQVSEVCLAAASWAQQPVWTYTFLFYVFPCFFFFSFHLKQILEDLGKTTTPQKGSRWVKIKFITVMGRLGKK